VICRCFAAGEDGLTTFVVNHAARSRENTVICRGSSDAKGGAGGLD